MKNLQDKVVVITGAASGIGRALALACAGRGARLMLADLNEAALASVAAEASAKGARCHTLRVDTGREQDIHELARVCATHFGAADVVINNAGVALVSSVEKLNVADAQWLMNINFWGVVHGCRAFLPQLATRPEAMLVNVSSIFAMVSVPSQSMYNAAKAAVRGFSDALREELRGGPVGVLCVHPGGVRTHIVDNARMADLSLAELTQQQMRDGFALNARTSPEQAAEAIVQAIERGQTRLMIGLDARVADWLYRIHPARASAWITALGRRRQKAMLGKNSPLESTNAGAARPAPGNRTMNSVIKILFLMIYASAAAGLFINLPLAAGPIALRITLILLAVHLVELALAFKHVRLYNGPLAVSVVLTLLYGLLHWKPLADAKARQAAAATSA